ncbi:hypothetical protein AB0N14_29410 [Streptomyces sp. NPDC051104]
MTSTDVILGTYRAEPLPLTCGNAAKSRALCREEGSLHGKCART